MRKILRKEKKIKQQIWQLPNFYDNHHVHMTVIKLTPHLSCSNVNHHVVHDNHHVYPIVTTFTHNNLTMFTLQPARSLDSHQVYTTKIVRTIFFLLFLH